jgi:uncharacterized protein YqjF (DUF2071 family)
LGRFIAPWVVLKRHPIPVRARFRYSLVLTYAFPEQMLEELLPPGLNLDTHNGFGFLAIAMVQTESLRPAFLPACFGRDFFLIGYRIFARYRTRAGRTLRGLRILRSDTDNSLMAFVGNRLTHYNYRVAEVSVKEDCRRLQIGIKTVDAGSDLDVAADLTSRPAPLPAGSPFANLREARHFAGPLPFTFDYETETRSIVVIEGVRKNWKPQPIRVEVFKNTFFDKAPFNEATPVLANAFLVENIFYNWRRGRREALLPVEVNDEKA